jgi:hypothetical protein
MTLNAPLDVCILFLATVLATFILFYRASRSITFLLIGCGWCLLQSILAGSGIYEDTSVLPPRLLVLGILPPVIFIIVMFTTRKGKAFIDQLDIERLTWFHLIRVPVEITLSLLFHLGMITVYQTMEGTNFDLFSGLTAPLVGWYAFRGATVKRNLLLQWNVVCLLLLMNVVITSALAMPGPLQRIDFPGTEFAVLYFPFNLLPTFIVPLVLFSHLAVFRRLRKAG